jgi:photosystem II stability/assembly factor-like uncharacterized protein
MHCRRLLVVPLAFVLLTAAVPAPAPSAPLTLPALRWRFIGPYRGGRTVAVTGVPGDITRYYIAAVNGGIWETRNAGRTWAPIFDGEPTQSIGALAVAPSDPRIIYAGSGEGLRRPDLSIGDGMWKSTDGGAHWVHLGLRDAQQIATIAVAPTNPDVVFAAVLGHPYGPNATRGLYRSTDGGLHWEKVLGPNDDQTGVVDVAIDPRDPKIVYAALWASRNGPWHFLDIYQLWNRDGLYRSADGGTTWQRLSGGLPPDPGRIGIAIAPSDPRVVYAWVNTRTSCGIYRSDDAGMHWRMVNDAPNVCGRGDDFSGLAVAPDDPQRVYAANTSTYRSDDGGVHFVAIKGAPGGDDYHTIWINPLHPNVILLGSDQGATLSLDGGTTWSSWYNQPTAQFYHVITDDRFPYWVYGGQQESGTAAVRSRGDMGEITVREWHPVGGEEYGYIAPDPLHPWIVYAGKVTRYDDRTHEVQDVSPADWSDGRYRVNRTAPLIFNRVNRQTLYLGANVVFATDDGGMHWRVISPDLTRKDPGTPPTMGPFAAVDPLDGRHRGVVYALGPSYIDARLIWAGTDDGLVWLTTDGGAHWRNVTPPGLTPWSKVAQIDPSHFSRGTAYVAVNRFRLDDLRPYVYVTHDFGRTWRLAVAGLPDEPVNAVREDPKRPGLLYAATETGVDVSFDDGHHWQSLQLNLPATSVRDIVVHGDDLVAGTHGRGFWILDDVTPLRSLTSRILADRAFLFPPADAYRVQRDENQDTPLPPETPMADNPPDGAVFDYDLRTPARRVTISIYDAHGHLVRRYASDDRPPPPIPYLNVPTYWEQPFVRPETSAGMHRFVWDLHGPPPQAVYRDLPISAVPHRTPEIPRGIFEPPGRYRVVLNVDGLRTSRAFVVRPDPRLHVGQATYDDQARIAGELADLMNRTYTAMERARQAGHAAAAHRLGTLNGELESLYFVIEGADAAPTAAARTRFERLRTKAIDLLRTGEY